MNSLPASFSNNPLTAADLAERLDTLLNPVLSSRRTAAPLAHALLALSRDVQDFTLHWVEVIARTNYEMAYQFAATAPAALNLLDESTAEAWIIHAMDSYDREGLHQGSEVFKSFPAFAANANNEHALRYEEAAPVLEHFIRGLSGRRLHIDAAPVPWTDTATLYLPPRMTVGASRKENFLIYKIIATLLWAQSRYGTFSVDLDDTVKHLADPARALDWLNFLEIVRLEAQITRVLPGLGRDLAALRDGTHDDDSRYTALRVPGATVQDSIALLNTILLTDTVPRRAWSGLLRPADAKAARVERTTGAGHGWVPARGNIRKDSSGRARGPEGQGRHAPDDAPPPRSGHPPPEKARTHASVLPSGPLVLWPSMMNPGGIERGHQPCQ